MSKYNAESFYRAALSSNIGLPKAIVGSTLSVSKVPTLTSGMLTIDPNTPNEEIVEYNGVDLVNKTITITKRGINPSSTALSVAGTDYNNASYAFAHAPLSIISGDINNIHINQNPDLTATTTITGDITFSGAVVTSKSLRVPSYADAAARDVAIPAPTNGQEVYLVAEGKFTDYTGGVWTDRASGTTPNASEAVAGKAEQATLAEQGALTEIGGTGAPLFVNPKNLKKTSSGAPDENKIPILDATGSINNFVQVATLGTTVNESGFTTASEFVTNVGGSARRITSTDVRDFYVDSSHSATLAATSAETIAGIVSNRFSTPAGVGALVTQKGFTIGAGSTITLATANTVRTISTNPKTKLKEIAPSAAGTYSVSYNIDNGFGVFTITIEKNGVAQATNVYGDSGVKTLTASITCNAGDLIQLWGECATPGATVRVNSFEIKYNLNYTPTVATTVNLN